MRGVGVGVGGGGEPEKKGTNDSGYVLTAACMQCFAACRHPTDICCCTHTWSCMF